MKHVFPVPPEHRKGDNDWTITMKPFCNGCYEEVNKAWENLMLELEKGDNND